MVGQTAYNKRKDRVLFERLAEKYTYPREIIKYLIANFALANNGFLYDRESGQEALNNWIRVKESLSKVFSDDLQTILSYFEKHHIHIDQLSKTCIILKLLKSKLINIETVNLVSQFIPTMLDNLSELPECKLLFEPELLRIRKLTTFVVITDNCHRVWNEFKEETNCTL